MKLFLHLLHCGRAKFWSFFNGLSTATNTTTISGNSKIHKKKTLLSNWSLFYIFSVSLFCFYLNTLVRINMFCYILSEELVGFELMRDGMSIFYFSFSFFRLFCVFGCLFYGCVCDFWLYLYHIYKMDIKTVLQSILLLC